MIKVQAIRGIKWTSVAALSGNLLQFFQLIIVSRFISTADYGLMALTLVITYFAQLFGDMGISNALIYKKEISKATFSTLFWVSMFFCWVVFAAVFSLAPYLSVFFKQPLLSTVIRVTACSFVFLPLQMQYLSLLRKALWFSKIAGAEIISKIVSLLVAVVFAVKGFGVFALVYSTLAGMLVSTAIFYYYGSKQVSIGFYFKTREIKEFLHFGIYQTGNEVLSYFNFQADMLLLGKLLNIDAVGYYGFAKNLAVKPAQIINPVVTQVAFPIMAKVNDDSKAIKNIYLKMLNYLSSVNFLIYPFIAALSDTIIRFFFGEKWLPSVHALSALAFYCMIRSVFNPVGVLLNSQGMVKRLFFWNLVLILILPVVVFISSSAGATAVALALTAFFIALIIPMCSFLIYPASGAGIKEFWQCIKNPLVNAVILYTILYGYDHLAIHPILLKLSGGFALWLIFSILFTRMFNNDVYKEFWVLFQNQLKNASQVFRL